MKKSTYIAIFLLIAGIICCVAAFVLGGSTLFADSGLNPLSGTNAGTNADGTGGADVDMALTADGVTSLALELDMADCTVQLGESWALTGDDTVTWRQDGSTLKIEQESKSSLSRLTRTSQSADITLTIPRETALREIAVEVDAGTFTADGLSADTLTFDADAGKITATNFKAERLEADVDAGSLALSGIVTGGAELGCDVGELRLELLEGSAIGTVRGTVDLGDITITAADGSVLYESDRLSENINCPLGTGSGVLEVECDVGSIDIQAA